MNWLATTRTAAGLGTTASRRCARNIFGVLSYYRGFLFINYKPFVSMTTTATTTKWLFFIHGISSNGELHGKALPIALAENKNMSEWQLFTSKASTSQVSSYISLYNTLQGVEHITQVIYDEIVEFFKDKTIPTHISLIGASFGGMVARLLVYKLDKLWDGVIFDSFVVLASPLLGVRGFYSGFAPLWSMHNFKSVSELLWNDENLWLEKLGSDDMYLAVLNKFQKRLIYASIWDDGIVSYESASLLGSAVESLARYRSSLTINESPLVVTEGVLLTADTIPYFTSNNGDALTEKHIESIRKVQQGMCSCGWTLFDVNTNHKLLATLHAPRSTETEKMTPSVEIAKHIIAKLE